LNGFSNSRFWRSHEDGDRGGSALMRFASAFGGAAGATFADA
jgi:hypothetical protein